MSKLSKLNKSKTKIRKHAPYIMHAKLCIAANELIHSR